MKLLILITSLLILCGFGSNKSNNKRQVRIAIVDTGLNLKDPRFAGHLCLNGHLNFVNEETISDVLGHGTCVASIIQDYAKNANYCLLVYKFYSPNSPSKNNNREIQAIQKAISDGADIINFSAGGREFNRNEDAIIKNNPQVIFVVAAGNEGQDLDTPYNTFYPAYLPYPNITPVGALDSKGKRSITSNYGKKIKLYELGENVKCDLPNKGETRLSGTSMATAVFSGKLVDKLSKMNNNGVNDVYKF